MFLQRGIPAFSAIELNYIVHPSVQTGVTSLTDSATPPPPNPGISCSISWYRTYYKQILSKLQNKQGAFVFNTLCRKCSRLCFQAETSCIFSEHEKRCWWSSLKERLCRYFSSCDVNCTSFCDAAGLPSLRVVVDVLTVVIFLRKVVTVQNETETSYTRVLRHKSKYNVGSHLKKEVK